MKQNSRKVFDSISYLIDFKTETQVMGLDQVLQKKLDRSVVFLRTEEFVASILLLLNLAGIEEVCGCFLLISTQQSLFYERMANKTIF